MMNKLKTILYSPAERILQRIPSSWKSFCFRKIKRLWKGQSNASEQELERRTEDFLKGEISFLFWGSSFLILCVIVLFLVQCFVPDHRAYERNPFGVGVKEIPLVLEKDGRTKKYSLKLEEQSLSADELNTLFSEFFEELEKNMKGKNTSFETVSSSLRFDESLEGYPFEITYEPEDSDYIRWDGSLGEAFENMNHDENLSTGILVTAEYGAYSRSKRYEVHLKKVKETQRERMFQKAIDRLQSKEKKTRENKSFLIPEAYGKVNIQVEEHKSTGLGCFLLGLVILFFVPIHKFMELQEKEKRCRKETLRDFPVIVHLLTIYMFAGLSFASAIRRISEDYEKRQRKKNKKYAFEEIVRMDHRMQMGVSQKEACLFWGKQFEELSYQKLSLTLIQTISKGTREARILMENMEKNAFMQRVDRARKEGEEAATRLLFPMIVLLCLVMVLIMYPALIRFQGF